jgi:hypothetical protein
MSTNRGVLDEMERRVQEICRPQLDFLNTYVKGGHFTIEQLRDIEAYVELPLDLNFLTPTEGASITVSHFHLTLS